MNQQHSKLMTRRLLRLVIGGLVFAVVTTLFVNHFHSTPANIAQKPSAVPSIPKAQKPDLDHPSESYETFLYVLQTGGCEITRPVAISWLDRLSIEQLAMTLEQRSTVLDMIGIGGHATWLISYRQHIFNSAFNALHLCSLGEPFSRQLLHLASTDPDRTMRLYAMQHLGIQRRIGHLPDGPLAEEVHATFSKIARQKNAETSGYVIDVLAQWEGENAPLDPAIAHLALATAADISRPVDVRVCALFAAGSSSIDLARKLAADSSQPIILRKASMACIGAHGGEADIKSLSTLRSENSRLAQAAEPALAQLRKRQQNSPEPTRAPY